MPNTKTVHPFEVPDANVTLTAATDRRFDDLNWSQVDSYIQTNLVPNSDAPGYAVGISRGADVVFLRGYGLARLALDERGSQEPALPWGVETMGLVGSVFKTLTAASILKLAEDNVINITFRQWRCGQRCRLRRSPCLVTQSGTGVAVGSPEIGVASSGHTVGARKKESESRGRSPWLPIVRASARIGAVARRHEKPFPAANRSISMRAIWYCSRPSRHPPLAPPPI